MKLTVLDRVEERFDAPSDAVSPAGCCCCCCCSAAGGFVG